MHYPVWHVTEKNGAPRLFTSKKEAIDFCSKNSASINFARMPSDTWRYRETGRLSRGVYLRAPFFFEDLCKKYESDLTKNHFLHLTPQTDKTVGKETTVSFTPNHEYGVMDRHTVMRPGRYLEKFFSDKLTADQIRQIVARFNSDQIEGVVVKIGNTRKDFYHAFNDQILYSPSSSHRSCMAYGVGDTDGPFYGLPHHPAEVYAAGDLAVAVLFHSSDESRVLARAVLYPKNKTFSKIYSVRPVFHDALESELIKQGFSHSTSLTGARLLFLYASKSKQDILMPYIDGRENYLKYEKNEITGTYDLSLVNAPVGFDPDEEDIGDYDLFIPDSTNGRLYFL